MALALTVTKQWYDGKKVFVVGTIVASGSYATGGDTINFTSLGIPSSQGAFWVKFNSLNGYGYTFAPGTTQANGKVRINTASNTELGAGAYPAGITGDTIVYFALFEIR